MKQKRQEHTVCVLLRVLVVLYVFARVLPLSLVYKTKGKLREYALVCIHAALAKAKKHCGESRSEHMASFSQSQPKYLKNPDLYARIAAPLLTGKPVKDSNTGKWLWRTSNIAKAERKARTQVEVGNTVGFINHGPQRKGSGLFQRRFSGPMMDAKLRESMRMDRAKTEYIRDERRQMMLIAARHAEEDARAAEEARAEEIARAQESSTREPPTVPGILVAEEHSRENNRSLYRHRRGISEFDNSDLAHAVPKQVPLRQPVKDNLTPHSNTTDRFSSTHFIQNGKHYSRVSLAAERPNPPKRASAHLISDSALNKINGL